MPSQLERARVEARANEALTEERVREALAFLGFSEVLRGTYVRLDEPHGRARAPLEARFVTTVVLAELVGNARGFVRLVRRFPGVHGAIAR